MVDKAVFGKDLARGEAYEQRLDTLFSEFYEVEHATRQMQREGIDRVFTGKQDPFVWTVEYKADSRARDTDNVFIETVSVDKNKKAGWAYTSRAQILAYCLVQPGDLDSRVLVLPMSSVKLRVLEWSESYRPSGDVVNQGYSTSGSLVPVAELETLCVWELALKGKRN